MKKRVLLCWIPAVILVTANPWPAVSQKKDDAPVVPPKKGKREVIELFNGKNLDGWVGHDKYWSEEEKVSGPCQDPFF